MNGQDRAGQLQPARFESTDMFREAASASGIPRTSRFVINEVYNEPGPRVIRSAFAIASSVSGSGSAIAGSSRSSTMLLRLLAVMLVSPRTTEPSSICAASLTLVFVEGKIFPLAARICDDICTAWAKSAVMCESAARNKLPKLCPSRSPCSKRN